MQQLHSIREEIRQGAKILTPTLSPTSRGQRDVHQEDPEPYQHHSSRETGGENPGLLSNSMARPGLGFAAEAAKCYPAEVQGAHGLDASANISSVVPIPVSAVSAGRIQPRDSGTNGSDILMDALLEEEVAHNAKLFFMRDKEKPSTSLE